MILHLGGIDLCLLVGEDVVTDCLRDSNDPVSRGARSSEIGAVRANSGRFRAKFCTRQASSRFFDVANFKVRRG